MSQWPIVALSDVFEIARGGSPRPIQNYLTDDPGGINWISISDASEESKYITRTQRRIRKEGAKGSRAVKPGDFLLTNSMSFGRPYIMQTSGCIHDGWLVFSKRQDNVDADFFFHLLRSQALYAEFSRLAAGATVKNLNIDLVRSVKVPLPPLREQRRIAEVLDRAEALRAKRRAALAHLDTLTQSIFQTLFGDPGANPRRWLRGSLGDVIASGPQNGIYKPSSDYGAGTRILRIDGFYDGAVTSQTDLKRVRISNSEEALYRLHDGDVVVNRVNSMEYLGKCALIPILEEPTVFESNMMRLSLDRDQVDPRYVVEFLKTQFIRKQITTSAKHAVNQSSINQQDVKGFLINIPPLTVQRDFAAHVAAVEKLKSAHRASLAKLDELFASLQHRAFRGEL